MIRDEQYGWITGRLASMAHACTLLVWAHNVQKSSIEANAGAASEVPAGPCACLQACIAMPSNGQRLLIEDSGFRI